MIPAIQLDPATMSLWVTGDVIGQFPGAAHLPAVVAAAIGGEIDKVKLIVALEEDENVKLHYIWIASSIWHEKRHFLDLALTNYGARRVRDWFLVQMNVFPIISTFKQRHQKIVFPIDIYADPVRCEVLGLEDPHEEVVDFANIIKKRKTTLSSDLSRLDTPRGVVQVGGEAQLEALAYMCQMTCIAQHFGYETLRLIHEKYMPSLNTHLLYRWFEPIFINLNLGKEHGDTLALNHNLIWSVLMASLSVRYWEKISDGDCYGMPPADRIVHILQNIPDDAKRNNITERESWDLVNAIVKRLWGRSVFEEIQYDWIREKRTIAMAEENDSIHPSVMAAYKDYHDLRGSLIEDTIKDPSLKLSPEYFSTNYVAELYPRPISAFPNPRYNMKLPDEYASIFSGSATAVKKSGEGDAAEISWAWACTPAKWPNDSKAKFSLRQDDAWLQVIKYFAPMAKIFFSGRCHRLMLEPELFDAETAIKACGVDVQFDPLFDRPASSSDAKTFFTMAGKTEGKCDITDQIINADTAAYVSPWELRDNVILRGMVESKLGVFSELHFASDWSSWVIHKSLLSASSKDYY